MRALVLEAYLLQRILFYSLLQVVSNVVLYAFIAVS